MIQIKSLDHIVLRAVDADAMIRFYCDVLGCTVERTLPPELGLIQLRAGSALIDIVPVDGGLGRAGGGPPGKQGHNMDHFCLRLENFDEVQIRVHLEKFGVEAGPVGTRYGADGNGPSMYLQDPDGNTVELKGPPE
ncbi:MAG: VOC family protein [Deltaproteobacteria bacterium]|nr:VOC family protein [Deltaproteobacteria bacterium]MBW2387067.1 VOC family protein [Deltaproteobacteria bacterium]